MTTTQEDYMRRLANIQNMGGVSVLSINTKKEPRFVILWGCKFCVIYRLWSTGQDALT